MTPGRARLVALSILVVCVVSVAASVPIDLANRFDDAEVVVIGDPQTPRVQELRAEIGDDRFSEAGPNPVVALVVAMCFLWMLVGVLIVSRQPGNWAGWTFLVVAGVFPLGLFFSSLVSYGARSGRGSVPWLPLWAAIGEYTLYPIALLPLLFLLYPDGHPPSPRWRWVARGLLGGTALAWLGFFLRPGPFNAYVDDGILFVNPTGIDALAPVSGVVIAIGAAIAVVSAIATAVAVTQRFRRSTGDERQQMRVLALVAGLAGTSFVSMWVISLVAVITGLGEETDLAIFPILFGFTVLCLVIGIPVAYLVAIFRHGLWDLDVVIRKTVRYAVVVIAFMVLGLLLVAAVPTAAVRRRCEHRRAPHAPVRRRARGSVPVVATAGRAARRPARVRPPSHSVRGALGVQRAGRRDILHRRRAAAHGAARRRSDRGPASGRVAVRRIAPAPGGVVAGRGRASPAEAE